MLSHTHLTGLSVLYLFDGQPVGSSGLTEKLLLKPKAGSSLQTQRVPRSNGEDAPVHCPLLLPKNQTKV